MSRLAAIEKSLYYPTPPHLIKILVEDHLRAGPAYSKGGFSILDLCAGEGTAVHTLANAIRDVTFQSPIQKIYEDINAYWREHIRVHAVELDLQRAQAAQVLLGTDHVLNCPAEQVTLLNGSTLAYSLLFLNPPYDQNARGRQELDWVTMAAPFVANDGLAILCLPDMFVGNGRYAPALKATMSKAGLNAQIVLRFPDPEYAPFKQVFIVALKESSYCHVDLTIKGILGQVLSTAYFWPRVANAYPALTKASVTDATPSIFDDDDAPSMITDLVGNPNTALARMIPLMPMRTEHAGMVAAAGMFNGALLDGQVIKGSTVKKEVSVVDEYTTGSGSICTQETIAEVHAAQLTILDMATGAAEMINGIDHAARFEELLVGHAQHFVDLAVHLYPPGFQPERDYPRYRQALDRVRAPRQLEGQHDGLFEPQAIRAAAMLHHWRTDKVATVVGEMGTGKTAISLAACAIKAAQRKDHNQKVVVLLPPKEDLVKKWSEEIRTSLREFKPTVFAANTITDVRDAFAAPGLVFILLKETTAKISSGWAPVQPRIRNRKGQRVEVLCPICQKPLARTVHAETRNTDAPDPDKIKTFCAACDSPLWTVTRRKQPKSTGAGYARYPLAKYIRDHYGDRYLLIMDEAHGYKSGDSARGYAAQDLLSSCHRAIQMTGTIYNGMASSIYYLLWRALPQFRGAWGHNDVQRFINQFGLFETIRKTYRNPKGTTVSGYNEFEERKSERPGVAPAMIAQLLPSTVFLGIRDLAITLPPYEEHTLFTPKPPEFYAIEAYLDTLRAIAIDRMQEGEYSLLAQFTWAKQGVWDIPTLGDNVEEIRLAPLPAPPSGMWPKEEALLRLVAQEKRAGRKVLCFVSQINRRDPTPRLCNLLQQYGMKGAVMRADVTKRVEFIRAALHDNADVIFASAPLVKEGIDLLECPTLVWFGVEFNAYLIPQANRRSWRIGQTEPVHVYYLAYDETPQAEAMDRVAKKLAAAQALQGDIRQGLAELLGEPDFVSRLQAATVSTDHFESSLTLADLPPLTIFTPALVADPPRPARAERIIAIQIDPKNCYQLALF